MNQLLATKFHIPPPRPRERLVSRPRLLQCLDEGFTSRLILLSAPAGFGKTTLVSEWVHALALSPSAASRDRKARAKVAWLSLEPGDNDRVRFLSYLIGALQTIEPNVGADLMSALQSPQPPPSEWVLTSLINEVASAPDRLPSAPAPSLVLVLDDYHSIEAQPIHAIVSFLLDHMPVHMHLVIATRADPPLPLARLRASGQMTEVVQADLRFTADEALDFLNRAMGLSLTEADVAALETRTEGWIAGLQLAALALQAHLSAPRRSDVSGFVQAFTGSHRYVMDYLVEEVLGQQPEGMRRFLCQTSILDRLTASLCNAVTGREDSLLLLTQLEHANLFLVSLDDRRTWYRYHRLFGDQLYANLQVTQPALIPELHRRAATWYGDNGFTVEAIGHTLAAGDYEEAADLVEQAAPEIMWVRGEMTTVLGWLTALPDKLVRSRPKLCLCHAQALLFAVQVDAAEARVHDAQKALETASALEDARVLGQMAVIQVMIASFRGDVAGAITLARHALEQVSASDPSRAALLANLGGASATSGDMVAAHEAFAEAASLYDAAGNTFAALMTRSYLGGIQAALGQLKQAAEIYRRILEASANRGVDSSISVRLAQIGLGALSYEWNDLEVAKGYLAAAIEAGERQGDEYVGPGLQLLEEGYLSLAYVHQAQGNSMAALDALRAAEKLAHRRDPAYDERVKVVRARMWLMRGDVVAVTHWAQESGPGPQEEVDPSRYSAWLVVARLYIAQGRSHEAMALLEAVRQSAEAGKRPRIVIEALLLRSLACRAQNQVEAALMALEQALTIAEPQGYIRLFLDEGVPVAELLKLAVSRHVSTDYARMLLVAWEKPPDRKATEVSPAVRAQALVEPLSPRELEVLALIAEGLSNREIAERLILALTTVKKHTSNILGKLGVSSRTQAVAQARKLGLI